MRKGILSALLFVFAGVATAQEKNVSFKKEKLSVNDTAICIIEKKKKGFLEYDFEVKNLEEKQIGLLAPADVNTPISGTQTYYTLSFNGVDEKVQISAGEMKLFSTGKLLVNYSEALAQLIAKYNLVVNGAVNKQAFIQLKTDYGTNWAETYKAQAEREQGCLAALKNPAKSDAAKPVEVTLLRVDSVSKFTSVMIYEIKQEGKLLGTVKAKGSHKSVKTDDAEYDYSSGMLDLDLKGGGPMNYDFEDAEGCIIARYIAEEKMLGTWKDRLQTKSGDIKKYNKNGVNSRLSFIQAFANFLVQKRYL